MFLEERRVKYREATEGEPLRIERIAPDSFLYRIGLREGDEILQVNGRPLKLSRDFLSAIGWPGELTIELRTRGGNQDTITEILTAYPD